MRALAPDVDAAAGERLGLPLDERLPVNAVRRAVALPREIVHALRHEASEGFHDGGWRGGKQRCVDDVKHPCFTRREVGLENQRVGKWRASGGIV